MSSKDIFICGGGTGGHYYSGIALAENILKIHPDYRIHFIGCRYGIEAHHKLEDERMIQHFVHAKGVKGKSIFSKIYAAMVLFIGIMESVSLLFTSRPKVVFGVGGYVSAPPLIAAILLKWIGKWKVALLEQNFVAGFANDHFKSFADRAFSGFQTPGFETIDLPLRLSMSKKAENAEPSIWPPKTIFILGGSQGAKGLNEKWSEMLPHLKAEFPEIKIIHQTGPLEEKLMRERYKEHGIQAKVFAFSKDMPSHYKSADLVICRAGAMTVFEVMAYRRPAIFVPYPYATDDHQLKNALAVQARDWVIPEKELSWEKVSALLASLEPSIPKRKTEIKLKWENVLKWLVEP